MICDVRKLFDLTDAVQYQTYVSNERVVFLNETSRLYYWKC